MTTTTVTVFLNIRKPLTCPCIAPGNGVPCKQPSGHSTPVMVLTPSVYSVRMCGTSGRSNFEDHPAWYVCLRGVHGTSQASMFPVRPNARGHISDTQPLICRSQSKTISEKLTSWCSVSSKRNDQEMKHFPYSFSTSIALFLTKHFPRPSCFLHWLFPFTAEPFLIFLCEL